MRVAAIVIALTADAAAEPEYNGGFGIRLDVEASSVVKVDGDPAVANVSLLGVHSSVSFGKPRIRYFGALDLKAGLVIDDAGFAFDVAIYPVGLGVQLAYPEHTAFIGVAAGIGAIGASGALRSDPIVPVQLVATFRLTERFNLLARGRVGWTFESIRQSDGMLALQRSRELNYLDGYYLGAAYRELDRGRFVGLVFGKGGGEEVFTEN